MRLSRQLNINNVSYPVIEDRILLDLDSPGRAQFLIDAGDKPITAKQIVSFSFGYGINDTMQRFFLGFIDTVNTVDRRQQLFCRELSATLFAPLALDLRHVTMLEVITEIHKKTGLTFSIGNGDYSMTKVANFYNLGNGYQAMQSMERVFKIPNYLWQQQGDGVIYAGSWDDSRYADKPMTLSTDFFTEHLSNSAKLAAIPVLRPGVSLNGNIISQIDFSSNHMGLKWKQQ
ncbi:hypothetical protein [Methylobacter sp. S3L5C]|uniref:hypothetical protein n=1 Tax=Methylobacter sp. S3L5C TaxID=2839024 RepID=UPI001FAE60ED|nr:hypothetical protein [Methylobacter sp. S3L5C]UOA08622.1 hypothetical protein KKZ03_20935 [Methylobacter sp. S3L5C]